jgi:hypothetical protein
MRADSADLSNLAPDVRLKTIPSLMLTEKSPSPPGNGKGNVYPEAAENST